jgi:hypothetical protein
MKVSVWTFSAAASAVKNLAAEFGVWHHCLGVAGQLPLGGGLRFLGSAACNNPEQQ